MIVKNPAGPGPCIARSRGFAISYEDAGQGTPVVLVPGFMQSAADYRQAGYLDRLAATHRVLIVDPLGHGRSDKPHDAEAYRAPDVAADVIAVMDAAGLERAALWGYSRGAWLAGMAAIEFPHRLSALILGGAGLTEPGMPETDMPPWVEALSRADWAAFWSLFQIPLTPRSSSTLKTPTTRRPWQRSASDESNLLTRLTSAGCQPLLWSTAGEMTTLKTPCPPRRH